MALVLLPLVGLALRFKGYKWTRAFIDKRVGETQPRAQVNEVNAAQQAQEAFETVRMVGIAARFGLYRANCLRKALVSWWMLAKRGIHVEIHIGVNKKGGSFAAHAWIKHGDRVLGDPQSVGERFSAFEMDR